MPTIERIRTRDLRYELEGGAGSDAVHTDPQYGYGVAVLEADGGLSGHGLAYTLGGGTDLVCRAIEQLAEPLIGREVEELMAEFGSVQKRMAEHHQLRWLGPHKGVIHLALASITNACFDLWAKARGVPLWRLLLDLSSDAIVDLVDWSYLEDVMTRDEAREVLESRRPTRAERSDVLETGYPCLLYTSPSPRDPE